MESRVDEKILDFINEVEKRKAKKDICNSPVKIGERYYEFEEREFFDERLKIYIPKDFGDMPMEVSDVKYSLESRPEIIKSNDDGSVVITLKIIDSPLDEEHVEELKNEMKIVTKETNPANVFYGDGVLEVNSKNIGYFEFKSYSVDNYLYNLIYFFQFQGKTLMGTFICKHSDCEEWRDVVFNMLSTIKILNK
ncbi:hypothetical protein [Clostridium saccharobutylicum]|uniref:PsbP C-terminal domain-containing protein n=1 Tax=Clostridium saccharobutylicum TaxID=169679 RepID=A0A1S8NBU7_CLOSA|nr:hypothetical protein [Clostridium saccharobutylicum]OOM13965.1 hypothetical protein CLOSAC_20510 [Clostridium saccharobutylicum]